MMRSVSFLLLSLMYAASIMSGARESATFDSAGKLTSLIHDGHAIELRTEFVVRFEDGPEVGLQPHDQRAPVTREGRELIWNGLREFPNGREASFSVAWAADGNDQRSVAEVEGIVSHEAGNAMAVESIEFVVDVPRGTFVGGVLAPAGISLTPEKSAKNFLFAADAESLSFVDAEKNWMLALEFDEARSVTVTDHWGKDGRFYRVRIPVFSGWWHSGDSVGVALSVALSGVSSADPVRLSIDTKDHRAPFQGFGGNYCYGNTSPVTNYTLGNLENAWTRHELKAAAWHAERADSGPALRDEFERIQRIHEAGIPFIVSVWRFPEYFYSDPHQKPPGTHGRRIAADRWDEMLDLIGSYLLHLKNEYGAEAAMFSFNEPDLGVDVRFSAAEHRDAIKSIGAHLASLGLNTKMLLGDTANPRGQHEYVLPTAHDPEAMQYVAGVSFHSWHGATPAEYEAWADVAAWLDLPLFVGEAGLDPGAWRNHSYDSYAYGLREAVLAQEILRHAHPAVSLYWEFSDDYSLVHYDGDGNVTPTGRFWLMKHFTNLTPKNSHILGSSSDQSDVLISAFGRDHGDALTVHIVNLGATREAFIDGLPEGVWRELITTDSEGYREGVVETTTAGPAPIPLPARSLVTLVRAE